jgi:hypothetical protein
MELLHPFVDNVSVIIRENHVQRDEPVTLGAEAEAERLRANLAKMGEDGPER